jgi:hypothetical protein
LLFFKKKAPHIQAYKKDKLSINQKIASLSFLSILFYQKYLHLKITGFTTLNTGNKKKKIS